MDLTQVPQQFDATAAMAWTWAVEFVPRIGGAALIFVLGYIAANWAARAVNGVARRGVNIDATVRPVLAAAVRYAIIILVTVAALSQLGVQTASVLAVLGAAGLAIGLALQGTLSNIAAGLMLLWLRPFRVGDYIETPTVAGRVSEIGLFVTEMTTFDGLFRFVPNSEIWNKPLTNHSRNRHRMMNFSIGIPLDADAGKAARIAREVLLADGRVRKTPPPGVFIDAANDNFLFLGVRAWLPVAEFWPAHRALIAAIREKLKGEGIIMQRFVHPAPDIGAAAEDEEAETPVRQARALRRGSR